MNLTYLLSTAIGINLFGDFISYISSIVFKNMIEDKIKKKSQFFASAVSFLFGIMITSIIIETGLGKWKNEKIKEISCMLEIYVDKCKNLLLKKEEEKLTSGTYDPMFQPTKKYFNPRMIFRR